MYVLLGWLSFTERSMDEIVIFFFSLSLTERELFLTENFKKLKHATRP